MKSLIIKMRLVRSNKYFYYDFISAFHHLLCKFKIKLAWLNKWSLTFQSTTIFHKSSTDSTLVIGTFLITYRSLPGTCNSSDWTPRTTDVFTCFQNLGKIMCLFRIVSERNNLRFSLVVDRVYTCNK